MSCRHAFRHPDVLGAIVIFQEHTLTLRQEGENLVTDETQCQAIRKEVPATQEEKRRWMAANPDAKIE